MSTPGRIAPDVMEQLMRELSLFSHYPPEVNGRNGGCAGCGTPVQPGAGFIVQGSSNGGIFATPLCAACLPVVKAEQEARWAARKRAR